MASETKQTQLNAFVRGGVRVNDSKRKKKRADGTEIEDDAEAETEAQFDAEVGLATTVEHAEHAEHEAEAEHDEDVAPAEPSGWVAEMPTTSAPTTSGWKKLR